MMDFVLKNGKLERYTGSNKKVVIPDGVTKIERTAFQSSSIESVFMPDSIIDVCSCAFDHCKSLKTVLMSANLKNIGNFAFCGCTSLKEVEIPDSVTNIGNSAFCGCSSLTSITIPDGVTSIDCCAFEDCPNLTIRCNPGSYAEKRAKEYGFKTIPIMSKMRLALENTNNISQDVIPDLIER